MSPRRDPLHTNPPAASPASVEREAVEWPTIQWSENIPPNEKSCYDHCIAETPFGRFLVTWKSWKKNDYATVDESPWGGIPMTFNSVDDAKAFCQRQLNESLDLWYSQAVLPASVKGPKTPPNQQQINDSNTEACMRMTDELNSIVCRSKVALEGDWQTGLPPSSGFYYVRNLLQERIGGDNRPVYVNPEHFVWGFTENDDPEWIGLYNDMTPENIQWKPAAKPPALSPLVAAELYDH